MRKDNELTIQLSGWSTRPHPDMYLWSMRLLDLARATTDLDAQREVYLELAEHFVETGSHITLMYDAAIVGMADNLVGYQFAADALTRYGNFPFWLE
jgi:hypothetical protein